MNRSVHLLLSTAFPCAFLLGTGLTLQPSHGQLPPTPDPFASGSGTVVMTRSQTTETTEPPTLGGGGGADSTSVSQKVEIQLHKAQAELEQATAAAAHNFAAMRLGFNGPEANRLLVVPKPDQSPASIQQARTELAIMSRILKKADGPGNGPRKTFRFNFGGIGWGERRELDALYLAGYGAVFLLDVDFPLVPPPKVATAPNKQPEKTDDAWERARRELAGQIPSDDALAGPGGGLNSLNGGGNEFATEYKPEQVKQLKDRLVQALRHASNIKSLAPNEKIVVQVSGHGIHNERHMGGGKSGVTRVQVSTMGRSGYPGTGGGAGGFGGGSAGGGPGFGGGSASSAGSVGIAPGFESFEFYDPNSRQAGSTMTLEVAVSAVSAWAAEQMTAEDFAREVRVSMRDEGLTEEHEEK